MPEGCDDGAGGVPEGCDDGAGGVPEGRFHFLRERFKSMGSKHRNQQAKACYVVSVKGVLDRDKITPGGQSFAVDRRGRIEEFP